MTRFACCLVLMMLAVPAQACDGEIFQAFRQLAGKWQVFRDGALAGRLEMRPVAGGCAMLEDWRTAEGVHATALHWAGPAEDATETDTVEDVLAAPETGDAAPAMILHQVYVDSTGWSIRADGSIEDGKLVYEGHVTEDGQELVLRATLHGLGSDEIVHVGETSGDAGETWQQGFTLTYRRLP